jgi:rod shape-determining protein MreC
VHDKQVRRRRAVLIVLVGVSLILLTDYFGESPSSPLHSVQRGIVEVLSPVQQGASKVLSPVRDIAGWFSDTLNAKSRADRLQKQVNELQTQVDALKYAKLQNDQLSQVVKLDNAIGTTGYGLVSADVISRDPNLWNQTIQVDKGSDDGVAMNDPVIGPGGLVGKVTTVDATVSVVTLITDHSFAAAAEVEDTKGDTGVLVPAVGNPSQLLVQSLPTTAQIQGGEPVITAGFKDGPLDSLYPPGIPIGTVVTNPDQNMLLNNQQVQVTPAVDLRHLSLVQIMTRPHGGTERAQVP